MSTQSERSAVGRVISFWIRHELIDKLGRLAKSRGVKRNAVLSQLIQDAPEE